MSALHNQEITFLGLKVNDFGGGVLHNWGMALQSQGGVFVSSLTLIVYLRNVYAFLKFHWSLIHLVAL